jgi:hypothetical protein
MSKRVTQPGYAGILGDIVYKAIMDYSKLRDKVRTGEEDYIFETAEFFLFGIKHRVTYWDSVEGKETAMLSLRQLLHEVNMNTKVNLLTIRRYAKYRANKVVEEWDCLMSQGRKLGEGEDNEESSDNGSDVFVDVGSLLSSGG